jgi:hypothetical protein
MKSAVAPNIFATEDVSIETGDRNARRLQSLQVLIKIIRSYSAEILRLTLLFFFFPRVKLLHITPEPKPISVGIAAPKGRLSPAAEKFWECAKEAASPAPRLKALSTPR